MNKVGKRRAYVFGCGEVFLSKQEDILKDYDKVFFFDYRDKDKLAEYMKLLMKADE